ncbi:MAG: YdcF family protein [Acutalibacteraceae bacterium]
MLKKKILFPLLTAVVLLSALSVYIVSSCKTYSIYMPEPEGIYYSKVDIEYSDDNIVKAETPIHENGYIRIPFTSLNKGQTEVSVTFYNTGSDTDISIRKQMYKLNVGEFNILYESASTSIPNIAAYPAVYITEALFFCIMAVYMIIRFRKSLKNNMYSYDTVFKCSLMIMCVIMGIVFTALSVYLLFHYRDYQSESMQNLTAIIMFMLMFASVPFVLIYSVAMTVSNISLIRHEGFRIANALGIAISVALIVGVVTCIVLPVFVYHINSIEFAMVYPIISALYAFFEVYLLSTKICALIAAKHKPKYDKDYIIILGCGIRKDGTLLPLLKGRADKAIEFYHKQLDATGKKAVFVPSGGQGSDEIISEGEAIKRYLVTQGIPEEQIKPETKSKNTLENMKFSKEIIGDSNAKVLFSTTNYHVFRSGIFASQAGLKAEGTGSKTKWYFWPNAFIREFVGLIVSQKKKIIPLTLIIILVAIVSALVTF